MFRIPQDLMQRYNALLESTRVERRAAIAYRKWLRFYLDFCDKYAHRSTAGESLGPFMAKLESKGQGTRERIQAAKAVRLYRQMLQLEKSTQDNSGLPSQTNRDRHEEGVSCAPGGPGEESRARIGTGASWKAQYQAMRDQIAMRNYSPKTLRTYTEWTRRFQAFTRSKEASSLETEDVKAFLTDLSVRKKVAASTQNQAFNALLFFFRHGLGKEFGQVEGVVRAKRRPYIPVVLSRREVDAVIEKIEAPYRLPVKLLYGCGLRISECTELRVNCFNLHGRVLTVHDGKGQKDRTMPLPESILDELEEHIERLRELHQRDLKADGYAGVFLPRMFERKAKNAAREFTWQWFFPAVRLTRVEGTSEFRRWHMQQTLLHRAIKSAALRASLTKRVTAHTFRHTFASHLLQANYDIVTIQRLLGHSNLKTTMIYTQTVPSVTLKDARSPLDLDL